MSSKARAFNIVFHLQIISPGHATVYSPYFLKTGNEMKRRKNRKNREKQVWGLISLANGNIATLSLRHNLTEVCSNQCVSVFVCTYMCKPCMNAQMYICIFICVCVSVCLCSCVYPYAWLMWVLRAFAVALKMKGIVFTYTHIHLQISLRLPACLPPCRRHTLLQQPLLSPATCSP